MMRRAGHEKFQSMLQAACQRKQNYILFFNLKFQYDRAVIAAGMVRDHVRVASNDL